MDLAVAMLDPEFRADIEKLEAVCADPDQEHALASILEAQLVVDAVEDIIDQAEKIIDNMDLPADAPGVALITQESVLAAGEKRKEAADQPSKSANQGANTDVQMGHRKLTVPAQPIDGQAPDHPFVFPVPFPFQQRAQPRESCQAVM